MATTLRISRLIKMLHERPHASIDEIAARLGMHPSIVRGDMLQIRWLP